jgi:hypothetical protein
MHGNLCRKFKLLAQSVVGRLVQVGLTDLHPELFQADLRRNIAGRVTALKRVASLPEGREILPLNVEPIRKRKS